MAHEKERELLEKFRNAINSHLSDLRMDGYIRDKMEIPESAIDSFLSTLPEEKEEKRCKEFKIGDGINDVLNFIEEGTFGCMITKDEKTSDERYVFDRDVKMSIEFNPSK